MCKSGIYIGNNVLNAAVTDGGLVPISRPLYKYGCDITTSGNSITICGCKKAYAVDIELEVLAASTDPITVSLLQDGVPVEGGVRTITVAGTSAQTSVDISTVVNNLCKCGSTLTIEISGLATTVTNQSIKVQTWGEC